MRNKKCGIVIFVNVVNTNISIVIVVKNVMLKYSILIYGGKNGRRTKSKIVCSRYTTIR
jgi:hypothetical protein